MSRLERQHLIDAIEKKRNSKVIAYITSDRENLDFAISPDVISIIHQHIMLIAENERQKLDLLIYSRGGASDVPWTLVSMFREHAKKGLFSVLIPYRAHSAATVVALGADEIVMTRKAELGPIDASIQSGPYNPTEGDTRQRLPVSVEDVNGYFRMLAEIGCKSSDKRMQGFETLTKQVHPLALGAVSRLLDETKLVGLRLLSTRAEPFCGYRNRRIIKRLSSEVYSHNHAISRTEAIKYLGLKQVTKAESLDIENEMWKLYEEYREMFNLEAPFLPEEHLISKGAEENTWNNLPLACIESHPRFDLRRVSIRVRKLRQVPPQVTINLGNMNFPQINMAPESIPAGLTPDQINALIENVIKGAVQHILTDAANAAAERLVSILPQKGFQTIQFDNAWDTTQ